MDDKTFESLEDMVEFHKKVKKTSVHLEDLIVELIKSEPNMELVSQKIAAIWSTISSNSLGN